MSEYKIYASQEYVDNYVDGVTSNIQTQLDGKAVSGHVHSEYMTVSNPTGTGSFSLNRVADTTIGDYSFAEGYETTASGAYSHAEGRNTIASSQIQHVQGKYNVEDAASTYAHIVGNGTADSARSNAHTLDWDGNAWFAGNVYVGGTGQDDTAAVSVFTANDIIPVANGGTGYSSIADTTYTTARYRASSLHSSETTPSTNGVICWMYE